MKEPIKTKGSPVFFDRRLGERLKMLRMSRGLTLSDLGKKTNVSFQQVQKYERGQTRISVGRLVEFAEILDVSVNDLIDCQKHNSRLSGLFGAMDAQTLKLFHALKKIKSPQARTMLLKFVQTLSDLE